MLKSRKLIIGAALALAVISGWQIFRVNTTGNLNTSGRVLGTTPVNIPVVIDDGEKVAVYSVASGVGQTALEVTRQAVGGEMKTNGSGTNAYVTEIKGRSADTGKKEYWSLKISGIPSVVGAGSYIISAGDQIEWQITTY